MKDSMTLDGQCHKLPMTMDHLPIWDNIRKDDKREI